MYRILHVAASFVTVLVAYWCYALVAVPFIEPPPKRVANAAGGSSTGSVVGGSQSVRREAELKAVFPAGSWEIEKDTIKLQNDQLRLLFKKYDNQGGGLVKLTPCTMVLMTGDEDDDAAGDSKRRRAPVIMQVPEGALLKFDEALDLKMAKIGKLTGGRLLGKVTIYSHGSKPGEEDDVRIDTRDLVLSESEAYTSQRVQFRYGPHYGSGHNMLIKLVEAKAGATSKPGKGPHVEGIHWLEIKHVEEFHLEVPADDDESMGPGLNGGELAAGEISTAVKPKTMPVEINCQGPFRIDLADNVITFEDRVDVKRFYLEGPCDQINCELLSVYLAKKEETDIKKAGAKKTVKKAAKKNGKSGLDKLEPRRIEALGCPVVVRSPRNKVEARGRVLGYDMKEKRILLDSHLPLAMVAAARKKAGNGSLPGLSNAESDPGEAFLRQGPNEIHAVNLQYEPAESQRQIGKLVAEGPGWFRGEVAEDSEDKGDGSTQPTQQAKKKGPPQILEASWQGLLRLRPDDQYKSIAPDDKFHVISMSGDTKLSFPGMGLEADEVHFWLIEPRLPDKKPKTVETPTPQGKAGKKAKPLDLKPHSMLACGKEKGKAAPSEMKKVKINSTQMTGVVDELKVWFEEDQASGKFKPRLGSEPTTHSPQQQADVGPTSRTTFYTPNTSSAGMPTAFPRNMFAPRSSAAAQPADPVGQSQNTKPENHFHIVGDKLKVSVTWGEKTELSKLTISGDVRLEETKTAKPDEEPVVVEGDQIVVTNASRPHATVIVTGSPSKPARFQGRGLTLEGPNINLNRGINRLWMERPGTMTLPPVDPDSDGLSPGGSIATGKKPDAEPMTVHWQERMDFNGRTITFEGSVLAKTRHRTMRTETLKVSLDRMVSFDQTSGIGGGRGEQPKVQEIHCRGGVVMESRTFDENGMLASTELMEAANLKINNVSGDIRAEGPGVVTTVRFGSTGMGAFGNLPGQNPRTRPGAREVPISPLVGNSYQDPAYQNPAAPVGGNSKQGLTYLSVTFQNYIQGNKFQRKIDFHDQVKAVYGPVESWEDRLPDNDPDSVGPDGAILSCRKLSVTSMPLHSNLPHDRRQSIELEATGNTLIEGMLFTARGAKMSFNQAKDLMILEGDGRTPATLYHQEVVGGPANNLHAQSIRYWHGTNKTEVVGAQSIEFQLDQKPQDRRRQDRQPRQK